MNQDRATKLALELMKLGISELGVTELLSGYPFQEIERQLDFLPYRRAKRPGAFLIEAVRNKYSPPKEFYASNQTHSSASRSPLDENSARLGGSLDANSQGHGTSNSFGSAEAIPVSPPDVRATVDLAVPLPDLSNGSSVGGHQQGYREPQ